MVDGSGHGAREVSCLQGSDPIQETEKISLATGAKEAMYMASPPHPSSCEGHHEKLQPEDWDDPQQTASGPL